MSNSRIDPTPEFKDMVTSGRARQNNVSAGFREGTIRQLRPGKRDVCCYRRDVKYTNKLSCSNCQDPISGGEKLLSPIGGGWIACSETCARAKLDSELGAII